MPVVKATESLGTRPVVTVLYGDPGICKTSLANTTDTPILLDFDRGVQRSFGRKDTLILDTWEELLKEEQAGTFKGYKTVIIDTAKAALDDFLMVYVGNQDYKLRTNKLKAYGAIGDAFKLFINSRRAETMDIVIIAHSKKDEDTKRIIPDVTGQSAQLLMRIADQVGYITMENNQRTISFNPTDLTVGKNVAQIDKMQIPDVAAPAWKTFGADLIAKVKAAIDGMNEAQREALEKSAKYQGLLAAIETPEALTELLAEVKTLPKYLNDPMRLGIAAKATELGWGWDKTKFVAGTPAAQPASNGEAKKEGQDKAAPAGEPAQPAAPAPSKPKPAAKPKPAPAPAMPVAAKQTLDWFVERIGKIVFQQGASSDQFTGYNGIDDEAWPPYLCGLQDQGYTFRDIVPAEEETAKKALAEEAATA